MYTVNVQCSVQYNLLVLYLMLVMSSSSVLQHTETYCTNPALVSPFPLQWRSTSTGVRDPYQRKVELWAGNVRSNLAIQLRLPR
jgi:hypothetical protein